MKGMKISFYDIRDVIAKEEFYETSKHAGKIVYVNLPAHF